MKVKDLLKNKYIAKDQCIFSAYNMGNISTISIQSGELVKVRKIEYDENENAALVMCKVEDVLVMFIMTIEQLANNFTIC